MEPLCRRTSWLLVWISTTVQTCWGIVQEVREVDYDMYDFDNSSNSTTSTPPLEPILSAEAIANITVTAAAIIFLTVFMTIIFCTFEKGEHKLRVKTALERNKQIDKQIAAEKRRKELRCEQFRQKQAAEAAANVLKVSATHTDDGEIRYVEANASEANPESTSVNSSTIGVTEATVNVEFEGQSTDVAINLENTGNSGNNATGDGLKLVEVSLDSYAPFSTDHVTEDHQHPPVLLVQPARDS